jgi:hypothetical protein
MALFLSRAVARTSASGQRGKQRNKEEGDCITLNGVEWRFVSSNVDATVRATLVS